MRRPPSSARNAPPFPHPPLYRSTRAAICQKLFAGHQPVAHGFVNPLDSVYEPEVSKYSYDPARAAALLDEAGWTVVKDGIRHNAQGDSTEDRTVGNECVSTLHARRSPSY